MRSSRFAEAFLSRLVTIFLDETNTPIKRQSAVLYLASYISRSKAVTITQARYYIYIDFKVYFYGN